MIYDPETPKPGEDFVVRLTTADGERLIVRIGRFKRESQDREPGRGQRYIQEGIKVFTTRERGTGMDGRQFPEAEYWEGKGFDLADLPYIAVWLLEAPNRPAPDSLEDFIEDLGAFMTEPEPVPSEFLRQCGKPFNSTDDFFRQLDDFLISREVADGAYPPRTSGHVKRAVAAERPDHIQLELF